MQVKVKYDAIYNALERASTDLMDCCAYISHETGKIYMICNDPNLGDEKPSDIEDASSYIMLPHKNTIGLGSDLVKQFAREQMSDSYDEIVSFFRRQGAYHRFKDFLFQRDFLEQWHQYEEQATEEALQEWCANHKIQIEK
jgi:hypothetical protein